jgi:hypothetical protein
MSGFQISRAQELLTRLAAFILPLVILTSQALGGDRTRQASSQTGSLRSAPGAAGNSGAQSSASPRCETAGKQEITITCHYKALPADNPRSDKETRIVLNDAVLSFKTSNESYMHVELTFTNESTNMISDGRQIYLAIDDDSGRNYVRRLLPHIDFRNLSPGVRKTISERLLVPALQPGHYNIQLWIPSSTTELKFDPGHNFLLSSTGVANKETGLNLIATFSVVH